MGQDWKERIGRTGLPLLLAGATLAAPADAAQEGSPPPPSAAVDVETAPRPLARAARASGPIRVDGVPDEAAWAEAPVIADFVQSQPNTGHPATERTEVRILYDDRYLYISAHCWETRPDRRTINTLERDFPGASTRDADMFAVAIDTFLDRRNSFLFLVNPAGALRDGQTFDDSRNMTFAWRAAVQVATRDVEGGWTLEMAIPWSALRFDGAKPEQVWGLNLLRRVRWKNEDSYWAPVGRQDPVHRMSRAGTLEGIEGVRAGRDLRLKPYASGGNASGTGVAPADAGGSMRAGADLKVGLTAGLTLDATLNTDFSHVEVDQERINLTRFSLFLPEQRDFFVENSGAFAFGDQTEREYRMGSSLRDFTLFHSRRIGLTAEGRPVPVLGGGRVTGRAGAYEVGLLGLRTRGAHGLPEEQFTVLRLRRGVGGGSDVGIMAVDRRGPGSAASAAEGRSLGADANLSLLRHMRVNAYAAATDAPGAGSDRWAGRLSVAWRDPLVNTSAFVRHVGEDFAPPVGFVRRPGVRHHYATLGLHPRPSHPAVQEVNPWVEMHYVTDPRSSLLTRIGSAGLGVELADGSVLELEGSERFERLAETFRVGQGAEVAPGAYRFREASVRYESNAARRLSGTVGAGGGGFFDGRRLSTALGAHWRPHLRWSLDLSADHNRLELPGVRPFTADVVGGRVRYAHSTALFSSAFVQYNSATEQVVSSLRVNAIHAPLSDVYLAYTERRDAKGGEVVERFLAAKVTRTLTF